MRLEVVQRILGLLLAIFSLSLLPPLAVALVTADGTAHAFGTAIVVILGAGIGLWLPVRRSRADLKLRDGFLVVVLFWLVLGLSGAIPFFVSEVPRMSLADAVFESMSGLTTTGATVITGSTNCPRPCSSTVSSCSGSAAWGSSCSRSQSCPCSASAACSCTGPRRRGR